MFIISGIGLVAFLLALNLTVAIGTINVYANIVAVNKSALFPSGVNFASVFISWLNFDLGFDVCFFDGMNTYTKNMASTPTQSVVELPKLHLTHATPPPLEAIKDELELESDEQTSNQDGSNVIPVEVNLSIHINEISN